MQDEEPIKFVLAKGALPHMQVLHSDEMHWTQSADEVWIGTHDEVQLRRISLRSIGDLEGESAGPITLKTWQALVADARFWV